ncbi:hypothetical protein [Luteibacter sp. ME-Dv--P-043b]|uniref:hypothetical protein n=1 Tax=Luteibacter sp. ME-Dv--P-043b TaxID=3040291 RepID=UPI0025564CDF|nr:hypothetical protein [Luteibacter sp. ME-Dv--P-043b]
MHTDDYTFIDHRMNADACAAPKAAAAAHALYWTMLKHALRTRGHRNLMRANALHRTFSSVANCNECDSYIAKAKTECSACLLKQEL